METDCAGRGEPNAVPPPPSELHSESFGTGTSEMNTFFLNWDQVNVSPASHKTFNNSAFRTCSLFTLCVSTMWGLFSIL